MPDPHDINSLFARIARRYDLANLLLSGGIDRLWRRALTQAVARQNPTQVLDLATGSGDVAFALAERLPPTAQIIGMDFCAPMLEEARQKQRLRTRISSKIEFLEGDGLQLPCAEATFDAVTISFGLRNMADRARALAEIHRVLRPGGSLFVLEFSQPWRWFAPLYFGYTRHVLPWFAGLITGDRAAYTYLNDSIASFPAAPTLANELRQAGFQNIRFSRLTAGIVALHQAQS